MEFDLGMVAICRQGEQGLEVQETWPVHLEGWLALGWRLIEPPAVEGEDAPEQAGDLLLNIEAGDTGPELDGELVLNPEAGEAASDAAADQECGPLHAGEAGGQAIGDGPSPSYEAMTKAELLDAARALGLEVKGSSSRADVLDALLNHQAVQGADESGEEPEPVPGDLLI
jgi:hypothetical protein